VTAVEQQALEAVMRSEIRGDLARRQAVADRRAILEDNWLSQLEAKLDELFRSPALREQYKAHASIACNALKRVVDKLATVYSYGVTRKLGTQGRTEAYRAITEEANWSQRLTFANRALIAYRAALARPVLLGATEIEGVDEHGTPIERESGRRYPRWCLHVFATDEFTAIPFDDDPLEPELTGDRARHHRGDLLRLRVRRHVEDHVLGDLR